MAYTTFQRPSDVNSIKLFLDEDDAVQFAESVSNSDFDNRNNVRVKRFSVLTAIARMKADNFNGKRSSMVSSAGIKYCSLIFSIEHTALNCVTSSTRLIG